MTSIVESLKKNEGLVQLIKFGLVGVISTIIDMSLLKLGIVIHMPLWLPVALGFAGGTVNGYYMNSRWTFKYKTAGVEGLKFSQFATISLIGLGLTEIIVNIYVAQYGHGLSLFGYTISPQMTGKLLAVALVFIWNYLGNKLWTFKK